MMIGRINVGAGVVAAAAHPAGWVASNRIAVCAAPPKRATLDRSARAVSADLVFWNTFHGAKYHRIQNAVDVLAQAYVATAA
jgi:hypothetical protein